MDAKRPRMLDWLVYLLVRVFVCAVQSMPIDVCASVSRGLAWLACDVVRLRHHVVDENLRHAFPGLTKRQRVTRARRMWEHLFLMVCEVAHVRRKLHRSNFHQFVTFEDKRELVRRMLQPRPLLVVTGHFGNFEVGGFVCGLLGFPTATIARPLDNPYLDKFIRGFRASDGQDILDKSGSSGQVEGLLAAGGKLSLLGDQSAGKRGCWVDFLGRPASYHKAVALLTLMNDTPMIVSACKRTGGPLQFELCLAGYTDPRTDNWAGVKELTQWYNRCLEQLVLASPDQYWWVHRRWKQPPAGRRRGKSQAAKAA